MTRRTTLFKLQITEEEMKSMTRYELKVEVKKRAKEASIDYLKEIKDTKTKMDKIKCTLDYLTCSPTCRVPSLMRRWSRSSWHYAPVQHVSGQELSAGELLSARLPVPYSGLQRTSRSNAELHCGVQRRILCWCSATVGGHSALQSAAGGKREDARETRVSRGLISIPDA